MTTTTRITVTRNSIIHHGCFFDIINLSAWNAGLEGSVDILDQRVYVFKMRGPVGAIHNFIAFLRFADGALGRVGDVVEEEDAVVPQTTYERPNRPDFLNAQQTDDAVVPTLQ